VKDIPHAFTQTGVRYGWQSVLNGMHEENNGLRTARYYNQEWSAENPICFEKIPISMWAVIARKYTGGKRSEGLFAAAAFRLCCHDVFTKS
jgi:hypothetical protein